MNLKFNKNEDQNKLKLAELRKRLAQVKLGGGKTRIDKHHAKGKMTARERVDYLFDAPNDAIEIGAFAGDGMYEEHGGCPSGGVVVKIGYVQKKLCIVVANDATVKAGAWFPITGKKNLRAQEIAIENKLPIIYLVDSAGVYLPLQDEIFPDKEHFGRIFRNNAVMSSLGITQISAVMGSCVGTRLVFEWNDSEAEFDLQFVNPENQYYTWKHSLAANAETIYSEKDYGYNTTEYLLDYSLPGTWTVNVSYSGNKSLTPTYLKATIYYNYGTNAQSKEVKVFKLSLKNVNQELFKIQSIARIASN